MTEQRQASPAQVPEAGAGGNGRVAPRNLTARLAARIAGNPDITRPEDAVANCYPGLELDVRNLDRRFFPGLVFEFVARNDTGAPYSHPMIYGARLNYVDIEQDPDLATARGAALAAALGDAQDALGEGDWYLDWIEQAGRRLGMDRENKEQAGARWMDGLFVWRLVRGLEPGQLKIGLRRRDKDVPPVELEGWRRSYLDPETGVINGAYQPGEMLQSLCSPWQHDFRDCYCHYWVSNHPDVVYGEIYPGEPTLPTGIAADAERAKVRLDWLRADRSRAAAAGALNSFPGNRPYQYDHFQINKTWQDLNVVINDTEIGPLYAPGQIDDATPFASPEELATELRENLAGLELALICEYLYAYFSLLSPEEAQKSNWPTLAQDVTFARHYLLLVATSEMQHLRWANELLWILYEHRLVPAHEPVLVPVKRIPDGKGGRRPRALRRLEAGVLNDFIALEQPSGSIDGMYSRVVATLRDTRTYPPHAIELAQRIVGDGVEHFSRFSDIRTVFAFYAAADPPCPYLRRVEPATVGEASETGQLLDEIIARIRTAYAEDAHGQVERSGPAIVEARARMNRLLEIGDRLAAEGRGIPFFDFLDPPA